LRSSEYTIQVGGNGHVAIGQEWSFDGEPNYGLRVLTTDFEVDNDAEFESATVWLGLKNSDDQGTFFDLRAEVRINGGVVADGVTRCIAGLKRPANLASEVTVSLASLVDAELEPGDEISVLFQTRIGTNPDDTRCSPQGGAHHNARGLRLYYDAVTRPSRMKAEVPSQASIDFYLRAAEALDVATPTETNPLFRDSAAVKFSGGNPWREVGFWSRVHP
jgi:hypothetical protein